MDFAPQVHKLEGCRKSTWGPLWTQRDVSLHSTCRQQALCQSPRVCKSGEVQTFGCSLLPLPLLLFLLLPSVPSTTKYKVCDMAFYYQLYVNCDFIIANKWPIVRIPHYCADSLSARYIAYIHSLSGWDSQDKLKDKCSKSLTPWGENYDTNLESLTGFGTEPPAKIRSSSHFSDCVTRS